MLVPLAVGFALAQRGAERVARALALVRTASNLTFVVFIVTLTIQQFDAMLRTPGSFAIGTYLIFVLGLFAAAWLLARPDPGTRPVLAFGAAQRNVSAALVVAGASFTDCEIPAMVLLGAIVGLVVLMALAGVIKRSRE